MAIEEVLTLISRIAFICCQGCLIAFWIMLWRQNRARKKREEEYRRDFEALQNLSGEEYWKALSKRRRSTSPNTKATPNQWYIRRFLRIGRKSRKASLLSDTRS